jgi:hypothetical protein
MVPMAHWAVIIPADRWATERLFHHETVTVPGAGGTVGDDVLVLVDDQVVALGRVAAADPDTVAIAYTRRAFDEPVPADGLSSLDPLTPIEAELYQRLATRLSGDADRRNWLVSVALPIEATSPAEAVRQFWSHVLELGPAELPTYVWPSGDELAMQAFVLGAEANQDPEEEDEDG